MMDRQTQTSDGTDYDIPVFIFFKKREDNQAVPQTDRLCIQIE